MRIYGRRSKICSFCKKEFTIPKNISNSMWKIRKFCSMKCYQKSECMKFIRGGTSWNKGKKDVNGKRPWEGKKRSPETILKMSINRRGKLIGKEHWNWQGGLSFEPYSIDWNETLKRSIRERDKYTCQLCSQQQGDNAFDVHHIDYDKKNCNPENLITLCRGCHSKMNVNREFWIKFWS